MQESDPHDSKDSDGEMSGSEPDVVDCLMDLLELTPGQLGAILHDQETHGTRLEEELVLGGHVEEQRLYRAIAAIAGVEFAETIPADTVSDSPDIDVQLGQPTLVRLVRPGMPSRLAQAPRLAAFPGLCKRMRTSITLRPRSLIVPPSAIRAAVWQSGSERRVKAAVARLHDHRPEFSARNTLVAWQGFVLGMMLALGGCLAVIWPLPALQTVHLLLCAIYFMTIGLRWLSLFHIAGAARLPAIPDPTGPLPVYSVLVALHREANVVPQLVQALLALDWPTARLDIKLVCEEDDGETLDALAACHLPPHVEIVRVPHHAPTTKPKALIYALAGARGDFLTIYDAEDRPHPAQLREAHARFSREDDKLVCLQAPLKIDNGGENWLADLFAGEYFAQFQGFLAMSERHGWPLPLGGTSNHFRTKVLLEAGGWDPFNVTEDADLGLRFARLGYRVGLLHRPTLENAPTDRRIWINQRSRWLKGWLQTFLVSIRRPRTLAREIGWTGLVVSTINSIGPVLAGLLYPFFFVNLGIVAVRLWMNLMPAMLSMQGLLMIADGVNMLAGYAYHLATVALCRRSEGKAFPLGHLFRIPLLWMMLTVAAWKAVYQLIVAPHRWNKTPHEPAKSVAAEGMQEPAATLSRSGPP